MGHPAFFLGFAIFSVFAVVLFAMIIAKGGFARSNQLAVTIALVRGEHGRLSRWTTIGSFAGIVLGAMVIFAGVAATDAARARKCQTSCVALGHPRGVIGPSVEQNMLRRNSAAFVACTCTGGAGPAIELRAE